MSEYNHFVKSATLFREGGYRDILIETHEVLANMRILIYHIFRTNQGNNTPRNEPFSGFAEELLLDPVTTEAIVERRVQPDEREGAATGPATEEVGWSQDTGIRKIFPNGFCSDIVQFDCKSPGRITTERIPELANGLTFSRTRIENCKWMPKSGT
jgi:hypothetical protein